MSEGNRLFRESGGGFARSGGSSAGPNNNLLSSSAALSPGAQAAPSTERAGNRTACVALSATAAALVLGLVVSLAIGPGAVEGGAGAAGGITAAAAARGGGAGGADELAMSGASAAAAAPADSPLPRVAAADSSSSSNVSSSGRWYDCPPGVALDAAGPPPASAAGTVSFLVVGDWGRQGNANQRRVSDAMADVAACLRPSYVVSTGDNFYPEGLFSPDDEQFFRSFVDVYGEKGGGDPGGRQRLARLPFYAALGNHDALEGRQGADRLHGRYSLTPALEASSKNGPVAAGRWQCYSGAWTVPDAGRGVRVAAGGGGGGGGGGGLAASAAAAPRSNSSGSADDSRPLLDLIVIDTNPFMGYTGAWAEGEREEAAAAVRDGLERRLRASRAAWRLVAGHHPVHSLGEHCGGDPSASDCGRMAWLAPLLREHGVAAYLAGHEHDLQLIFETSKVGAGGGGDGGKQPPQPRWPAYVVSGGGSNIRGNEFRTLDDGSQAPSQPLPEGYSAPFVADKQGFVAAVANATHLALHYYALDHRLPAHTTVLARRA